MTGLIHVDTRYKFIPPHYGNFWPRLFRGLAPSFLRHHYGITSVEVRGAETVKKLHDAGQGVLIAPNHCRMSDAVVLQVLSAATRQPFFFMASYHLFRAGRFTSWALRRMGAFSIFREGVDRQALDQGIDILSRAERPLVIFPEGVLSSANDSLNELQEGVSFIARSAAARIQRQQSAASDHTTAAPEHSPHRPIAARPRTAAGISIVPVAIRYVFEGNLEETAGRILTAIEQRLSWASQSHLPLFNRILRVGSALLTLKEVEFLGRPNSGSIAERQHLLIDHLLSVAELEWLKKVGSGSVIARVRDLHRAIVADMIEGQLPDSEMNRRWTQLKHAELAQAISLYPADYVANHPTAERILETIERFHEHLTGESITCGPLKVIAEVGDPLPVAARRERGTTGDPLLQRLDDSLRELLKHTADECHLDPRSAVSCPSSVQ